ncbi:hypothetical protein [Paracoccus sp. T5]|uniref:hypothetical protein n=1 Tax=Paracoccus sp. T5 TaxID=3402161 RepID=UPI003AE0FD2E
MVIAFSNEEGVTTHHSTFVELMRSSRSLATVRAQYRGSRTNVIALLSIFGYDFDALLSDQFTEGYSDIGLADLHGVDSKWIAFKRTQLGFTVGIGRPRCKISQDRLLKAYEEAGTKAGAARSLGISPATFRKLFERVEPASKGAEPNKGGSRAFRKRVL